MTVGQILDDIPAVISRFLSYLEIASAWYLDAWTKIITGNLRDLSVGQAFLVIAYAAIFLWGNLSEGEGESRAKLLLKATWEFAFSSFSIGLLAFGFLYIYHSGALK